MILFSFVFWWVVYEIIMLFIFFADCYDKKWKVIFDLIVPFGGIFRWLYCWPGFFRDTMYEIKQSWSKLK